MMALRAVWTLTDAVEDMDAYYKAKERFDRFRLNEGAEMEGWSEVCDPVRWMSRAEAAQVCISLRAAPNA